MIDRREQRVFASLASLAGVGAAGFLITLISGGDALRGLQVAVFLTVFAVGPGIALALCAEALLERFDEVSWGAYAATGLFGGGLLSVLFLGVGGDDPNGFLTGLACGAAGASAYWAVLRPDRYDEGDDVA